MPRFKDDPRIITAKFNSVCAETGKSIKKGEECIYYPRHPAGKRIFHLESSAADDFMALKATEALGLADADW